MKWLALLGIAVGIGVLGAREVDRLERRAAEDIESRLQGESRQVNVSVFGPSPFGSVARATIRARDFSADGLPLFTEPDRSQRGILQELRLEMSDFELAGLRVRRLVARIPDCRFDLPLAMREGKVRLSRSGVGTGEVEVAQEDLASYLVRKFPEIKRCAVEIDRDKAFVEGYGEFVIVKAEFRAIASLEVVDGTKLMLTDARIWLDGRRADEASRQALLDTLNPVIDLSRDLRLYDAISVTKLRLRDGVLKAWGTTRIPEAPKPKSETRTPPAAKATGGGQARG